jgi:hypothetical protein
MPKRKLDSYEELFDRLREMAESNGLSKREANQRIAKWRAELRKVNRSIERTYEKMRLYPPLLFPSPDKARDG